MLIKVISELMESNGNDDPDLIDYDFWTKKVEADQIWYFLTKALTKDIDQKDLIKRKEDPEKKKQTDTMKIY